MYFKSVFILCVLNLIQMVYTISIFNNCEMMGADSFATGNFKCDTKDIEDQNCAELFYKGCKNSKIKNICEKSADQVLINEIEIDCSNLKKLTIVSNIHEKNISLLCCQFCQYGIKKSKNNEICDAIATDSDTLEYHYNNEMERCCKSPNLKSNECKELKCEYGCMIDGLEKTCFCDNGYELNKDNRSCDDIDECDDLNKCNSDQLCVNSIGSFKCLDKKKEIDRIPRSGSNEDEDISTENTTPFSEDSHKDSIDNFIPNREESVKIESNNSTNSLNNPEHILKSNSNLINSQINLIILLIIFYFLNQISYLNRI